MNEKGKYIEKYKELKAINNGKKPLKKEFLHFCNIHERVLLKLYGKDSYSKLQQDCGDNPNKLQLVRTPITQILDQYGDLVRKHQRLPVTADWIEADFYPRYDGLRKVHNLRWPDMPVKFIELYSDKIEWKDVIEILNEKGNLNESKNIDKNFIELLNKLNTWLPDRKRTVEEGYKIELRKYLSRFFNVEEEVGDSNPDLLINGKYPIELKKDPSQSEYDRLLINHLVMQ